MRYLSLRSLKAHQESGREGTGAVMKSKSNNIPSLQGLVSESDITSLAGLPEVFQLPYEEPLTLGFRFKQQIIGVRVEGEFSVELMYKMLSTWMFVLLKEILLGKPVKSSALSKAKIRMNPQRLMRAPDLSFELENSFVQEALSKALPLMLARMQALPWRALVEAIISVILDLEENEIILIEGSRAEIWNAHAEALTNKLMKEMCLRTAGRTRRWNKAMRRKALRLYEDTMRVLRELKRTYFGSRSRQIRRKNPNLKSWKEAKAEYPQLRAILDRLSGYNLRELATTHVGNCLGSASKSYTYQQIKIARAERRRNEKSPGPSSKRYRIIEHSVDAIAKKWDAEHRNLMSPKTLN